MLGDLIVGAIDLAVDAVIDVVTGSDDDGENETGTDEDDVPAE